jgi:hypothetical protein
MPPPPVFKLPPPPSKPSARPAKTFSVGEWTGNGEGRKVMLYAGNGMGKTTLASMAPNPVFIGLDDGGRQTRNPKTGEPLKAVQGIETWEDLRDAVHQASLFPAGSTLVLDTITRAESLAVAFMLRTIKVDGHYPDNLEGYGWGKGYTNLVEIMRLLLGDFDPLVRRGVNILLLAQQGQATVSNLEGADYIQDGPLLASQPKTGANVRAEVNSWVDDILRIGYPEVSVAKASKESRKGKASGTTTRQVYTEPEIWFVAKNRMNGTLPPVVSFAAREDDSLWQFLFPAAVENT